MLINSSSSSSDNQQKTAAITIVRIFLNIIFFQIKIWQPYFTGAQKDKLSRSLKPIWHLAVLTACSGFTQAQNVLSEQTNR